MKTKQQNFLVIYNMIISNSLNIQFYCNTKLMLNLIDNFACYGIILEIRDYDTVMVKFGNKSLVVVAHQATL